MADLKDYLSNPLLEHLQDAFSAVLGAPVCICSPDGEPLIDAPDPADWDRALPSGRTRTVRQMPASQAGAVDVPVLIDGMVAGRVCMDPEAEASRRLVDTETMLRLMSCVIGRLCDSATRLHNRVVQLLTLFRVLEKLNEQTGSQEILDAVTQIVMEAMTAKACSIRLLSEDGQELRIQAVRSFSPQYLDTRPIPLSESPLDQEILASDEPVYVADMASDPRVHNREQVRREGVVSALCARMAHKDTVIGTLRVFMGVEHEFDWFDRQLLMAIASAAAAAILNVRLHAEAETAETIRRQLAMAGEVQRRMIPQDDPTIPGLDIYAFYEPSYQLAGDFYDYIDLPEDNLGLAICDVVGKGVRASLMMAFLRASLRAHAMNVYDISQILTLVNRDMCAGTAMNDFATLFYGVLDARAKRMTYCCGGHIPPVIVRDGQICRLKARGGVVGVVPEMTFPQDIVELQSGDVLLAYTDGLSEALSFDEEEYGHERIEQALLYATSQGYSAQGIARYCVWDMSRFAGLHMRRDDLTVIAIRIL